VGRTILHISTRLILGGSQENTVLSCIGQARLGHRVHLAFGPIYGPEGSHRATVEAFNERVASGLEPGVEAIGLHEVPHLVREVRPVAEWRCLRELEALIRAVKPEVVHTHSSKAGILGRWAAWRVRGGRSARLPAIVHTIHGPPFMPVDGERLQRCKRRVNNAVYTVAERFAARRCDVIVSVADAMTEQFLARGIGERGLYTTVRSGMETGPYLRAEAGEDRAAVRARLGLGDGDFVLGTVARLAEHKGHDDVLDALAEDLRAQPHWKLLWVGDGWWKERLLARVDDLGLRGQVVTTGLVGNEKIPGLVRAMEVLIHPSYREGLPRTVPQAMLAGTAVVASDADGTPEVCLDPALVGADRATGLLFPVGDAGRLRGAVRWMAEHPAERAAMAERARAFCAERFSAEAMVAELEKVYARALGG
jgi:glycosyltransferase involved in cell wall biosynthesis